MVKGTAKQAVIVLPGADPRFEQAIFILSPGTAPFAWVTTSLVAGIPGIIIQLILIPLVVVSLTRAKLLPSRYSN